MRNVYAYERISTNLGREKQTFARQDKAINKYVAENKLDDIWVFKDDCSGKDFNRPQWQRLDSILKDGDLLIIKDISRFTRQAEEGYKKYMELLDRGVEIVFLDNPTVSSEYIHNLMGVAAQQELVAKTALESTIKLLLIVELDRCEKERLIFIKRIKDGLAASDKKSGRKTGQLDKLTPELRADIEDYLTNRSLKQKDLVAKHNVSINTLKKYTRLIREELAAK